MKETTSGGLVKAFRLIWAVIKLNLFFVLFTMMGAVLFGVGPAFQTISDLIEEEGLSYEDQTFRKALRCWKQNFWRANARFYLFFGLLRSQRIICISPVRSKDYCADDRLFASSSKWSLGFTVFV